MLAIGKALTYYIIMCTNVTALAYVFSDICMFILFSKEQRKKLEEKDQEELRNDEHYNMVKSYLGCATDEQFSLVLVILGTYVPGLNVIFWKGMVTGPFEKRSKIR